MSLFSAIRMGANTLRADQIAIQVIGQNIANANTPGYIREETVLKPAPTQRVGSLLLGLGVEVDAVIQKIDNFLEERLRGSVSEEASAGAQEQIYTQLEGVLGELSNTDLSTALNNFFNSISQILNQPESVSVRNLAVLQGKTLTQEISRMADRVMEMHKNVNDRVKNMADDINRLIEEVRVLNLRIADTEGGNVSKSDAVGLRDQRLEALENLAKLIDIRCEEQPSGTVTVYASGSYLVADGIGRPVKAVSETVDGLEKSDVRLAETDMSLNPQSGELRGLYAARDDILGSFLEKLNSFAGTLAFEFNKLYSGGQGLSGYQQVTSQFAVDADNLPLDNAGLTLTPVNGSFDIQVFDTKTKLTRTTQINVNLTGLGKDTTLSDLAAKIGAIPGLSATVADGKLTIASNASDQTFAFANDTSGVLAALGINTFFTGTTAYDLGVSTAVQQDPAKFAASRGGIAADTKNAEDMVNFLDRPIPSQNGTTLSILYDRMVADTTQGSTVAKATAEGARAYEQTLRGQKMATSGVNLDEEAINMISYQRSFQASARFIKIASDLLEVLVTL